MRGVVSLAAALAIPITLQNGTPFPQRHLILYITFMVILLTLLIQGLTLPFIIRRANLMSHSNEQEEEKTKHEVKHKLVKETVRLLKEKQERGMLNDPHLQRMIDQWEHKINQPEKFTLSEDSKKNYLEILEQQRIFLATLNKDPDLDEGVIRQQIYQIDLEEERVRLL